MFARPAQAEAAFLAAHPAYAATAVVDRLRASEYARLDAHGDVYLDYTGGSVYAASQLEEHQRLLRETVFGNPHSVNPTSAAATCLVEQARAAVLRHFGAPEDEYACIFTPNASGALRLVGDAYPFGPDGRYLATADNHNSVVGIREFARAKGARTGYVPLDAPGLRVADGTLEQRLARPRPRPQPLRLPGAVELLRRQAPARVDRRGAGARLGRAARLRRLRTHEPARPGGLEAGLRRALVLQAVRLPDRHRGAARAPRRARPAPPPWFSGGTVVAAGIEAEFAVPLTGHARFEDGTVDYLGIPAVEIGLRALDADRDRHDRAARRARSAPGCSPRCAACEHADGSPATRIYGPSTWDRRGATIAFNFLDRDGRVVDERLVDRAAAAHRISLRTGCFCNPGAGEAAFALSPAALRRAAPDATTTLDDHLARVGMPTGGAVRVSLGLASSFADVPPLHRLRDRVPRSRRRSGRPAAPAELLSLRPSGRSARAPARPTGPPRARPA